jgi:hypothetical protein
VEAPLGRLGIDGRWILNEYWGNWVWECGLHSSGLRQGIEETGYESVDLILLAQDRVLKKLSMRVWTWFFWYKSFKETGCEGVDLIPLV